MNITKILSKPRTLQAMTGVSEQEFLRLVPIFEQVLIKIKLEDTTRINTLGQGIKGHLATTAHKLFFILFYLKVYPTFDVLGCFFNKGRGRSCEAIHLYTKVLQQALGRELVLPTRKVTSMEQLFKDFPEIKDVFIDGVERKVQRPINQKRQKKLYSGKKKIHAKKNIIVTDEYKKILFLSTTRSARRHDKRLADKDSLFEHIPKYIAMWLDTGFQGTHKQRGNICMPKKASKGKPLAKKEKAENKLISAIRVRVEHAIGSVKRFNILATTFRNRKPFFDDLVMELGCGLHNLHLKMGHL